MGHSKCKPKEFNNSQLFPLFILFCIESDILEILADSSNLKEDIQQFESNNSILGLPNIMIIANDHEKGPKNKHKRIDKVLIQINLISLLLVDIFDGNRRFEDKLYRRKNNYYKIDFNPDFNIENYRY